MTEFGTKYFDGEGRASMEECLRLAAKWCVADGIGTMVIFSGTGEGPHYAAREILLRPEFKNLKAVAVTPPVGREYRQNPADPASPLVRAGLSLAMRDELTALNVSVVSSHLPFKEMYDGKDRTSEWLRVAESFGILGGGFALCVQAILVACDAGLIDHGERVVAATADTAFVARACRTESFLSPIEGLLVGHVICRPRRYNISKRFHETIAPPPQSSAPVIETTASESKNVPALTTTVSNIARSKRAPKKPIKKQRRTKPKARVVAKKK